MKKTSVIYEPHKFLKQGIRIWPQMVRELIDARELIARLFIRDMSVKYRQSILGNLWIVIMPFVAIGTFLYLSRTGLFTIHETDMPYPLYAFIGLSLWQIFATGLNSGCQSLIGAGDMITRINFPREALVIASMAQTVFEFLVKAVMIFILLIVLGLTPAWPAVFFPLAIIPLLLLTLGVSLQLSLLNGLFRDTANVVGLLVTFLMFLTPVLYPIPAAENGILRFNILGPLVSAPRDLIVFGTIKEPGGFAVASVTSVLLFLISWRIFHLAETKIPERI